MDQIPLPVLDDIEIIRRSVAFDAVSSIPEDCVAVRISRNGKVSFLTQEEYDKLINDYDRRSKENSL